jgi:hypothetical protein
MSKSKRKEKMRKEETSLDSPDKTDSIGGHPIREPEKTSSSGSGTKQKKNDTRNSIIGSPATGERPDREFSRTSPQKKFSRGWVRRYKFKEEKFS